MPRLDIAIVAVGAERHELVGEVACGTADLDDLSYAMQRATTSTSTPAPGMIQGGNTTLSSPEPIATLRLT